MYRVGMPFWRAVARAGRPLRFRVNVYYDPEVSSYWATSPDVDGLTVTGATLDELMQEVQLGAQELLELAVSNYHGPAAPDVRFRSLAPA